MRFAFARCSSKRATTGSDEEVSSKDSGDSSDTSDLISTDTSDDEEPAQKGPATRGLPTTGSTGSKKYAGRSGSTIWDNDYFYLKRHKLDHKKKIYIYIFMNGGWFIHRGLDAFPR